MTAIWYATWPRYTKNFLERIWLNKVISPVSNKWLFDTCMHLYKTFEYHHDDVILTSASGSDNRALTDQWRIQKFKNGGRGPGAV